MTKLGARLATAAFVLALVGAGCASGSNNDLTIAHVHGLGVTDDTLFVATHHGLYTLEGDEWSRRSSDRADHMGFSLVSERLMFRSGHPERGGNLGVQRSTDGGRTWRTVSGVLDSPVDFHAMASTRSRPVVLYGWFQGLFRSVGDPERWEPLRPSGLPSDVGALAAAGERTVYASTPAGLYRSDDRGESWVGMESEVVFALAAGGDTIYASKAHEAGVLRSTDGGESWTDVSEGLDSGGIVALAASGNGKTVVAADQNADLWRIDDGGGTWTRIRTP